MTNIPYWSQVISMQLRHLPREASRYIRHTLIGLPRLGCWESRANSHYLAAVRRLAGERGAAAGSILDIGSDGCPYLDWFDWMPRRVSLDLERPYAGDRVGSVKAGVLAWEPRERFGIVLCLQVLEHIPDAARFAQRLIAVVRRHVIVSVPYKWRAGRIPDHVHDPVDEAKVLRWFGREPDCSMIVSERGRLRRLICCYAVE
jgi:hypothetical protein